MTTPEKTQKTQKITTMEKFTLKHTNNMMILEHHQRPKFVGKVVFRNPFYELEDIVLLENETDPNKLAKLMAEAGDFISLNI
jgi:hypothetical protein